MNEVTEEKKEAVTKTFAIVGFIAIILLIVYLAVQIITIIPSAFSTLASVAGSVYGTPNTTKLTIATRNSIVNNDESFGVSWTQVNTPGSYSFSYDCVDGISVTIKKGSTAGQSVSCNTSVSLGDITSFDMSVSSQQQRFIDVPFTITFAPDADSQNIAGTSVITVVNATLPTHVTATSTQEQATSTDSTTAQQTATSTHSTTLTPGTPKTIRKVIYKMPVSDPNGYVDLQITQKGVGILSGKQFIPTAQVALRQNGAIQFQIKNIGTKTANDWDYEADLPNGMHYRADRQDPLKPNETALITIGFAGITQTGIKNFGAQVHAAEDTNDSNNSYYWTVRVLR